MTETELIAKPSKLEDKIDSIQAFQKQAIELENAMKQLEEIKPVFAKLSEISESIKTVYDTITDAITQIGTTARLSHFKTEEIQPWLKHVWAKYQTEAQKKREEFIIALPRFVTFSVGWWDHSDEGYHYFKVNRFTDWLAEVPLDIRKELGLRQPKPLAIEGDMLVAKGTVDRETWQRYKSFLKEKVGENTYRIKPKLNYPLAVQLVKDGILPYSPNSFPKELIEEQPVKFKPEPWQEDVRKVFRKYSNVGVFAPPGTGKNIHHSQDTLRCQDDPHT